MRRDQYELGGGTVIAYGHYGRPFLVFPSEQGRAWDFETNGMIDAVRPLIDPDQIVPASARLLGEHLGVDRCAYAEIEADEDMMNLTGNYCRHAGIRSIVGRMPQSLVGVVPGIIDAETCHAYGTPAARRRLIAAWLSAT